MYYVVNFCNDLRVFTTLFHVIICALSSFLRFVFGWQYIRICFLITLNIFVAGQALHVTCTNNHIYDFLHSLVIHSMSSKNCQNEQITPEQW
jgi:hypothetical protein